MLVKSKNGAPVTEKLIPRFYLKNGAPTPTHHSHPPPPTQNIFILPPPTQNNALLTPIHTKQCPINPHPSHLPKIMHHPPSSTQNNPHSLKIMPH